MSKIKPILEVAPGTRTIWHKMMDLAEIGMPMFEGMVNERKRKLEALGHGDLAEETMVEAQFMKLLLNYLKGYDISIAQGNKTAIYSFCLPPELFYMLDIYPMCQEVGTLAIAVTNIGNISQNYIDLAEEAGISSHECNAQKIWLGATLCGEAPKPDAIIYSSQPCDSTNNQYQILERWYGAPTFTIDIPYWSYEPENPYYDEDVLPYMANQLKNLLGFLERVSGNKTNEEKLKHIFSLSNEARENISEVQELVKHVPSPVTSISAINNYFVLLTNSGLPSAVEYSSKMKNYVKEVVKRGLGGINLAYGGKKEEKFRVVSLYPFNPSVIQWMERKYGAIVVQDMLGYQLAKPVDLTSEETIMRDLGKTVLDMPMGRQSRGPMYFYFDDMIRLGKEYKADCYIFGGHVGCKHSWGGIKLLTDVLKEETGLSTIVFETDVFDPRVGNPSAMKKKLKVFFDSLK